MVDISEYISIVQDYENYIDMDWVPIYIWVENDFATITAFNKFFNKLYTIEYHIFKGQKYVPVVMYRRALDVNSLLK